MIRSRKGRRARKKDRLSESMDRENITLADEVKTKTFQEDGLKKDTNESVKLSQSLHHQFL